jgi:hypothetical protein
MKKGFVSFTKFMQDLLSSDESSRSGIMLAFLLIVILYMIVILSVVVYGKKAVSIEIILDNMQNLIIWLGLTALGSHGVTSFKDHADYKESLKDKINDVINKIP